MDQGEWLSDEVEEDVNHILDWNIDNETEKNLQNRFEHNGHDEEDFFSHMNSPKT